MAREEWAMRTPRTLLALAFPAVMILSLPLGSSYEKTAPLKKFDLRDYSSERLFMAAQQAYLCSFLMHLAGQIDKARHLRSYSVRLMSEDSVRLFGKNWNDVSFPGAVVAFRLSDEYAERFSMSQKAAAGRLLTEGPQCKTLNRHVEKTLGDFSR